MDLHSIADMGLHSILTSMERTVAENLLRAYGISDKRLDEFLERFIALRDPLELCFSFGGQHCDLVIKNGLILSKEEVLDVLNLLDTAGIMKALPPFDGGEFEVYVIDEEGEWRKPEETLENVLFVSYRCLD